MTFIYLFTETYLYRVDIISRQAIFHMCPVEILLYEKQTLNYIIYNTGEHYNTDKKRIKRYILLDHEDCFSEMSTVFNTCS